MLRNVLAYSQFLLVKGITLNVRHDMKQDRPYSQVHRSPKCDTHGHFCLIFSNLATLTNSSTLISKIIVAKLNSCVKMVFWGN